MDDLLKKLNTLVSSQVNDLAAKLPGFDRKPDVSRQAADLRQRVNTAMAHEEQLRSTVLTLRDEIANLDSQVNASLQNGQEPIARALLDQMQRLEKRLAFAEADLRQHQASAADLIVRVSALEAAIQNTQGAGNAAVQTQTSVASPISRSTGAPSGAGSIGALMDAALNNDAQTPPKTASDSQKSNEKPLEKPVGQAQESKPAQTPAKGAVPKPWTTVPGTAESGGKPKRSQATPQKQKPAQADPAAPKEEAEKPYTAKDQARDAREGAEKKLQHTNEGFESVGGLLRDIQARTKSRMDSLDKMLSEGGLLDADDSPPAKPGSGTPADKPSKGSDLEDRLKRLSKPD